MFKKSNSFSKAQGTIEYLIIIAIVVVIALVVVSILTGFLGTGTDVGDRSTKISNWTNSLSLTETSVDPDGNYLVRLVNNNDETITVSNVSVGDESANFSEDLMMRGGQNFVVPSTDKNCNEGENTVKTLRVTYFTKYGLEKTEVYPASTFFECSNYTVNLLADRCEVCPTLVWGDVNDTPDTWYNHINNCARKNTVDFGTAGYEGWRMPTVEELDAKKGDLPGENLWTSTTVHSNTSNAYFLLFDDGLINVTNKTYDSFIGVRCVRSE